MTKRYPLSIIVLFLLMTDVFANPVRYTSDRWHTRIYFTISHMGLSHYQGRFIDYDIDFMFDEDDFSNSRIEVTVPINGIDTFSPELNEKMPDEKFFATARFPNAHFVSTAIETIDKNHAAMTGDLTILGITVPVSLDVVFNVIAPHPLGKSFARYRGITVAGFSARTTISRSSFGMTHGQGEKGDTAELTIEVEGWRKR